MEFRPHEYQKHAIEEIKTKQEVGLFLDMGLGKTVITLTAINDLMYEQYLIDKVLVIAPLATAKNTWRDEVEKWDHLKHLRLSHVLGNAQQRRAALKEDADIYIINRENVQWLCEEYTAKWPFDMLVLDELSSFKNPAAKRFKALRKKRPWVGRVVGLTGTPAPNGYMDLWSEIYLLDRGERLGKTLGLYRQTYFRPIKMNGYIVYEWGLKQGCRELIDEKLSDLCVSMKAEDWLDMPERVETEVYVSMTEEEREVYDTFGRDHVLPDENVVGLTAATVQNKLLQMANGFAYDTEGNVLDIHTQKLVALQELIEAANRPVIVYYSFVADRERIQEALPEAVVLEGRKQVKDWNAGKIPVLLAHPASAGHGLNLQEGGNTVIWYGLPWSLELYQQANARLYRQGQKYTVYIYHILTRDTHDVDVLSSLRKKNVTQEELLKVLKARIAGWSNEPKAE